MKGTERAVALLLIVMAIISTLALSQYLTLVRVSRERDYAVRELEIIKKEKEYNNALAKYQYVKAINAEAIRQSEERKKEAADQENLRVTAKIINEYASRSYAQETEILDSVRTADGSRIFRLRRGNGRAFLVVNPNGHVSQSSESIFNWSSFSPESYASWIMSEYMSTPYVVESLNVIGPGSMDATVRSTTTAKRERIVIEGYRLESHSEIN